MSFQEAVAKGTKTMLTIRKEGGLQNLTAWLMGRLVTLFEYLGAYEHGVTDFQIETLARRICSTYFYLTPGEIDYFFVCFENGKYRRLYNNGRSVNPQDIMISLIDYEHDVLEARGRAEEKRMAEDAARRKAENAEKPHGMAAWKIYCAKEGLNPATHKLVTIHLPDVNEVLATKQDNSGIIKKAINKIKQKL